MAGAVKNRFGTMRVKRHDTARQQSTAAIARDKRWGILATDPPGAPFRVGRSGAAAPTPAGSTAWAMRRMADVPALSHEDFSGTGGCIEESAGAAKTGSGFRHGGSGGRAHGTPCPGSESFGSACLAG